MLTSVAVATLFLLMSGTALAGAMVAVYGTPRPALQHQ
jgi:hypothetical protein